MSSAEPHSPPESSSSAEVLARLNDLLREGNEAAALEYVSKRPGGLPQKSPAEAARHARELILMQKSIVEQQIAEEKERRRLQSERDSRVSAATRAFQSFLDHWPQSKRDRAHVTHLASAGMPPRLRGPVWSVVIGNTLLLRESAFEFFRQRGEPDCVALINTDLPRTFSHQRLAFFRPEGPLYEPLRDVLVAHAALRPDIGYVQGMGFLVGMLLLQIERPAHVFVCFANLMLSPLLLSLYSMSAEQIQRYMRVCDILFEQQIPALRSHLRAHGVRYDAFLLDWFMSVFAKSLPIDVAVRIWDLFVMGGDAVLLRTATALLRMHERVLLAADLEGCMLLLQHLPDLPPDELMRLVDGVPLTPAALEDMLADADSDPRW